MSTEAKSIQDLESRDGVMTIDSVITRILSGINNCENYQAEWIGL